MNCKSLIFSIVLICTGSTSILADEYQRGYSSSRTCTRNEYREEYIPGTRNDPGYVKKWEETVEVPCPGAGSTFDNNEFDNNDCSEGKIAGGIRGWLRYSNIQRKRSLVGNSCWFGRRVNGWMSD